MIMLPTILLYIVGDLSSSILEIFTANKLGAFADDVFQLNYNAVNKDLFLMVIYICLSIAVVPIINMFGETMLFKNSLSHDIKCLSVFFNKTNESVNALSEGEVQSKIEDSLIDLRCNLVDISEKTVIIPITIVFVMINMLSNSYIYTLIILVTLPLRLVIPLLTKNRFARFDMEHKDYHAKIREKEIEILKYPYIIKIFGLDNRLTDSINEDYYKYLDKSEKHKIKFNTMVDTVNQFIGVIFNFVVLFSGAILAGNGHISPGSVAPMILYFNILNSCVENVGVIIKEIKEYSNDLLLIEELYNSQENEGGINISSIESIECRNLCYSIENVSIIRNLSFEIKKGEKVAIVGDNGSGKTTLLNILTGQLEDYSGEILINGVDMRKCNLNSLRECFSYITQNAFLFSCSVLENVKIGNFKAANFDINRVMSRLKILYLKDKCTSFNTNDLSGGEKQRVSIARSLLHNSDFMFIDEGDNNLDKASKGILAQCISNSKSTIIFVSHNQKMISYSDFIINIPSK